MCFEISFVDRNVPHTETYRPMRKTAELFKKYVWSPHKDEQMAGLIHNVTEPSNKQ